MGKNVGLIKIKGKVAGLIFRETEDGNVVQGSCGPSAEKVKTHPNFEQTRKNASEFAGAVRDSMLLRRAMGWLVDSVKHSKLNSHMNKCLHRVAMSDVDSSYGFRCAHAGNIHLLEGFDLNHQLSLRTALPMFLDTHLDVDSGCMRVGVPDKIVRRKKEFPAGATHFRIVSCAMVVDLDQSHYSNNIVTSELLPLNRKMPAFELHHQVAAVDGEVMLQMAGIVFYSVINERAQLLSGGALQIVNVARKEADEVLPDMDDSCLPEGVAAEEAFSIGMRDAAGHTMMAQYEAEDPLSVKKRPWKKWWKDRPVHRTPSRVLSVVPATVEFAGYQQE